jgi:hypothetical protein
MAESLNKTVQIEIIGAVQKPDNVGETIDIAGMDLSHINEKKKGVLNLDHDRSPASVVGRIISAQKILKKEDCKSVAQAKAWAKVQAPFLWVKGELMDGYNKNADAVAGVYRYYQERGLPPPIDASVEGKTLERRGNSLKRTMIKALALTLSPCNPHATTEVVEVLKNQNLSESAINDLMKSEPHRSFHEVQDSDVAKAEQMLEAAAEMLDCAERLRSRRSK